MHVPTLLLLAGLLTPCLPLPVSATPTYQVASTSRDTALSGLLQQALALEEQSNHTQAAAFYTRMLDLLESQPDAFWMRVAYTGRARARKHLNNLVGAYEDYSRAIEVAETPKFQATQYVSRGGFRYGNGDREGAIADYTAALKINPEFGLAYYYRALTYAHLEQFERAIADFKQLEQIYIKRGSRESAAEARAYVRAMEQKLNGR